MNRLYTRITLFVFFMVFPGVLYAEVHMRYDDSGQKQGTIGFYTPTPTRTPTPTVIPTNIPLYIPPTTSTPIATDIPTASSTPYILPTFSLRLHRSKCLHCCQLPLTLSLHRHVLIL